MENLTVSIEPLQSDEITRFFVWRKGDGNSELISDLKETIGGFQGGTVWVFIAKIGEEWVGSVKLQRFHEDREMADGQQRGYLGALEVENAFRRRGIGRMLTERALDEAKQRGMTEITLRVDSQNLAARNLYREMGFEPFKTAITHWQGEQFDLDCLLKSLSD